MKYKIVHLNLNKNAKKEIKELVLAPLGMSWRQYVEAQLVALLCSDYDDPSMRDLMTGSRRALVQSRHFEKLDIDPATVFDRSSIIIDRCTPGRPPDTDRVWYPDLDLDTRVTINWLPVTAEYLARPLGIDIGLTSLSSLLNLIWCWAHDRERLLPALLASQLAAYLERESPDCSYPRSYRTIYQSTGSEQYADPIRLARKNKKTHWSRLPLWVR